MNNRRKLWSIFGPVIVACLLVLGFFALPWSSSHSQATLQKAADSLSPRVFKNSSIKVAAMQDKKKNYIPFFGSSELNRMDRYHPAVMAARYHNYTPFLFGSRGTQSLPQLFNMTMMAPEMKNGKAVYIISPQWFVKEGVMPSAFKYYNGTYANLTWLKQANPDSPYDRYTAKRLVKLLGAEGSVANYAKKIADGKHLSSWDRTRIDMESTLLKHEDELFSGWFLKDNYNDRIKPRINELPKTYNYSALTKEAISDAKHSSNNNRFGILNQFYDRRVKGHLKDVPGSQKHYSYLKSPEYADLEVVLNQLKKTNTNVVFMITPVNAKWEKMTGLSMPMYYQTANKIKYQLRSQGFNNIVDYSHDGGKPGFMEDTIHIGWAGWVNFDHRIAPFLEQKQPQPHYHMNKAFLSSEWQNLNPTTANLNRFTKDHLDK